MSIPILQSPPGAEVTLGGKRCLYFAGTAYLAMQRHPLVIRALCEAAEKYGTGAATARSGFGNQPPLLDVEAAAAEYFGAEDAFYFPSGYSGPTVLLAALADEFDAAYVDEQSHYAVFDALRGCGLRTVRFAHKSVQDLKEKLRAELQVGHRPLLVSDGVFAASGRVAPVREYLDALKPYPGAGLLLDDAHGVGVLGDHGRGTLEHFGVPAPLINHPETPAIGPRVYFCATLSKALGGYGGIIPGSLAFIARCKSASHLYAGCSAPPAPLAAAATAAMRLLIEDPTPRHRLGHNAQHLRTALRRVGLECDEEPTPVVALDLGDEQVMRHIQRRLMDRDIAIAYLKYAGTAHHGALRIAVCCEHTREMIDHLAACLREAL